MTDSSRATIGTVIQVIQLATLILGVAGLFLAMGRRDQMLSTNSDEIRELREISADLARTSIESSMTDREQNRRLDDLRTRLNKLEAKP